MAKRPDMKRPRPPEAVRPKVDGGYLDGILRCEAVPLFRCREWGAGGGALAVQEEDEPGYRQGPPYLRFGGSMDAERPTRLSSAEVTGRAPYRP
jgi:hypothetical protein